MLPFVWAAALRAWPVPCQGCGRAGASESSLQDERQSFPFLLCHPVWFTWNLHKRFRKQAEGKDPGHCDPQQIYTESLGLSHALHFLSRPEILLGWTSLSTGTANKLYPLLLVQAKEIHLIILLVSFSS